MKYIKRLTIDRKIPQNNIILVEDRSRIILGESTSTDTVAFHSTIDSNIIPVTSATYSLGTTGTEWASAFLNKVYSDEIRSSVNTLSLIGGNNQVAINSELIVNGTNPIGTAPVVTNVLYVTMDGDDTNDGRAEDPSRACRTITGATQSPYYQPGTIIKVRSGRYLENNPIELKPNTAVIGDDLRTTSVEPINKTQDLFHVRSGCYLAQMQFLNGRSGVLPFVEKLGYNRGAYCVAFPPFGDKIDVYQSPYVQNCTNQNGPWLYDGTMFIPNQTVQVPDAVGLTTFVANTSTITVTISTGTISVGMSINMGPKDPGFFDARTLILANKPFVQEQVIAYINNQISTATTTASIWYGFSYDQAKCSRDVGIILENVSYDAAFGGNEKSRESGLAYYNGVTSVIGGQEAQTIAAINYINTLTQLIITNSTATNLLGNTATQSQVFNTNLTDGSIAGPSFANSIGIITSIINSGTSVAPDLYRSNSTNFAYVSAETLLEANRSFIQDEVVAFINATYPAFTYDQVKCRRDVGLIVDALAHDVLLGGNSKTVEAGLAYWTGSYSSSVDSNGNIIVSTSTSRLSIEGEVTQTVAAFNRIKDISLDVINNTLFSGITATPQVVNTYFSRGVEASTSIERNVSTLVDIITYGPSVAPTPLHGPELFAQYGIVGDDVKPASKIVSITTISTATYSITLDKPTRGPVTDSPLYFGSVSVYPLADEEVPAEWQQRRLDPHGGMGGSLVDGGRVSDISPIQSFVYDAFTQVTQGGRGIHITNNGYAQLVSVFTIFCDISVQVDNGGICSIANSNANFGDICLLAKGYGPREFQGTIYNPPVAPYYPDGFYPNNQQVAVYIPDLQYRPHIGLVMEVVPPDTKWSNGVEIPYINDQGFPGFLTAQPNISTLATGTLTIQGIDNTGVSIGQYIYVRDYTGSQTHPVTGKRYISTGTKVADVGYQSITLDRPINEGGGDITDPNFFTMYSCGNAYYNVLSSSVLPDPIPAGRSIIPGQGTAEQFALGFISTLTQRIVTNTTSTITYQNTATATVAQVVIPGISGDGSQTFIGNEFNIVKNIAANGATAAPTITTTGTIATGAGSAGQLILANIPYVQAEVLGYIDTTFNGGFSYNTSTCSRDTGLIVDALAMDLLYEGTSQLTFSGLQYWSQTTSNIPGEQTTTTQVLTYVRDLAVKIAKLDTGGPRYQATVVQDTSLPTAGSVTTGSIYTNVNTLTNIINSGTVGVTDKIIPNGDPASSGDRYNGYNLLLANKSYIQAEAIAYANTLSNISGFDFDRAICSRDVGYIVDSLAIDVLHGGNRQSIQAGVYYYNYSTSTSVLPAEQIGVSVAAFERLKVAAQYVINNVLLTVTPGNSVTQVTNLDASDTVTSGYIETKMDLLTGIINTGPSVAPSKTSIGVTKTSDQLVENAYYLLKANRDFLRAEVIAYINYHFVDEFRYDVIKCKRDVDLILRAVSDDLLTGGNYNAVYSGLSYWSRSGTHRLVNLEDNVRDSNLFPDGTRVNFYQRSYMSALSYTFEYVGAGTNYSALPQVGRADPVQTKETVMLDNGKVFFTSTDQNGDFRIGPGLVISQATGVLSGRTFTKSLFANMTPFIIAIEGTGF